MNVDIALFVVCWAIKGEHWTCSPPMEWPEAMRLFQSLPVDATHLATLFNGMDLTELTRQHMNEVAK